jgi:hypothetical protein
MLLNFNLYNSFIVLTHFILAATSATAFLEFNEKTVLLDVKSRFGNPLRVEQNKEKTARFFHKHYE